MAVKKYGIVLLPDKTTEHLLQGMAGWTVGNKLNLFDSRAHLSVLHVTTDELGLAHIKTEIDRIHFEPLQLECYEVFHRSNGWAFWQVRLCPELIALQEQLLWLTELRNKDEHSFTWKESATPQQVRAYEKYGYAHVGNAWDPHFTFAKVPVPKEPSLRSIDRHFPWKREVVVENIAVGELREHGMLANLLRQRNVTPKQAALA